jgi:poly(A) polymerase
MTNVAYLLNDPRLARLFAALERAGGETRIVGGAVRDALLGLRPHEVDLATTALPERVMQAAREAGLKPVPTGVEHGTVTIVVDGTPFEVTTLREDVETDGRFARVRFGADFEQDALRRDFTVNALSLSPNGRLHDYTGGRDDLAARRVRFIGDAATRIAEDHLRALRFFRFSASIGDGALDAQGLHAAIVARENLSRLSRERVRAELLKLLVTKRAVEIARVMSQSGIVEVVLGVAYPARFERFAQIEAAAGRAPDAVGRLGAFAALTVEDAERLRERLRLSNGEHARIALSAAVLEGLHGDREPRGENELLRLLFLHGREGAADAMTLAHTESGAAPDAADWSRATRFLAQSAAPVFPVRGADLIARGVLPGQTLGATLKTLQANWIRAGFPRDPQTVMRLVEEATRGKG